MDQSYHYDSFTQSTVISTYLEPNIENTQKFTNFSPKNGGYMLSHYVEALE